MNTMYFAVLFFIAAATAFEVPDPFGNGRRKCQEQFGYSDEQLLRGSNEMDTFTSYLSCLVGETGYLTNSTGSSVGKDRVLARIAHAVLIPILKTTVDCTIDRALQSNAQTEAERIVSFSKSLKELLPPVLYNLLGVWEKPTYPYLETCKKEYM